MFIGLAEQRVAARATVLATAYAAHPERFPRGLPRPPARPEAVWMNPPKSPAIERLAHHAFRGGVWDKALTYSREAGTRAFVRSAHRTAVRYFEQGLEALQRLAETPPETSARASTCASTCAAR